MEITKQNYKEKFDGSTYTFTGRKPGFEYEVGFFAESIEEYDVRSKQAVEAIENYGNNL